MAERWIRHTVADDEAGRTVEQIVVGVLGVSRRRIQKLTRSRGLELNRRPAFLGRKVRPGDVVSARAAADEEPGLDPAPMDLEVVHEDADLLVIDKPPFMLVHPTSPHHRHTLAHGVAHLFLEQGLRARVRPVHRLDRDTSGLVLIAKTPVAHARLDRQLRAGELRREYEAFVEGVVGEDSGLVEAPIARDRQNPNRRVVQAGGDPAVTRFRVLERFPTASLLALELETGRTHQLRVHLAHLGHPVLGDVAYRGARVAGLRRQALHASRLGFAHPTSGARLELAAPLPQDLRDLRSSLLAPA